MNTMTMTMMNNKLAAVTAERDHWKANHDNRVRAAKLLTERTDMPMERIGAYKQYTAALESNQKLRELAESAESELLAVREDNHSMMLEIHNLRIERDALAAELAKLRAQEPVAYLDYWKSDGTGIVRKQRTTGVPFFNHPVPAPADSAPTNAAIRESHALKNRIESLAKGGCVAGLWVNFESGLLLCNYILQSTPQAPAVPTGASIATPEAITRSENWPALPTPTPFIPDADTRRNDAEFAAQQAAPSVPEEWRAVMAELAADLQAACDAEHPHRDQYPSIMRKYQNDMRIVERARALLLSADHSEQTLEKVAPDCRACANRGRINGLSQESYCDSCIYEGRGWRQNHFVDARKMVDAVKRRCEACAILPCSCK